MSFYNIFSVTNFYFSILLIKIIYLHNKIIYLKIQIKTKTQITTCYHHHDQPSIHHQSQTHQQPQHRSNPSSIQTHQPNKPISTNQKNPATTPKKPTTNKHQPSKPTTTPGIIISHKQTHEPTNKQTHEQPSKPPGNKQTHEQPSASHEQPTRKKTQPPPSKPTITPTSNHQEKPTKKPPLILLLFDLEIHQPW